MILIYDMKLKVRVRGSLMLNDVESILLNLIVENELKFYRIDVFIIFW